MWIRRIKKRGTLRWYCGFFFLKYCIMNTCSYVLFIWWTMRERNLNRCGRLLSKNVNRSPAVTQNEQPMGFIDQQIAHMRPSSNNFRWSSFCDKFFDNFFLAFSKGVCCVYKYFWKMKYWRIFNSFQYQKIKKKNLIFHCSNPYVYTQISIIILKFCFHMIII